jgi:nucleoside-diphosphate-sugar epimerase
VLGTLAVFEAAALNGQIERVVYASSAAVHGPPDPGATGPVGDEVRLAPMTHYGAFKVCNELNARVYWLDRGITSIGLRPWTVYGVGRDFGVTSEPTKAIKAVAAGRSYAISYGGVQDLQYVGDVAATFVRALTAPFEGADAFNVRGAVEPIERFVAALRAAVPESAGLVTHGNRQLPIAPDLDDARLQARLGPLPRTSLEAGIRETYRRFVALRAQGRLDLSDLDA